MPDPFMHQLSPPQASLSNSSTPAPSGGSRQPKIRRRNRLITSCLECRRRKLKCDKTQPCTNCTKFSRDCVFIAPALDPAGQAKLAEVKEKMGMLERTLEDDVARRRSSSAQSGLASFSSSRHARQDDVNLSGDETAPEDEKDLEPTPLATEDAAYYDDADDDLVDLGIQLGKMRITERVGGYVRPKLSEELAQALKEVPVQTDENPNTYGMRNSGAILTPGRDYVAPSSGFYFVPGIQRTSLMQYLPKRPVADQLVQQYWKAVHVIARTVHRPTFERQYMQFWDDIDRGTEPKVSFQAVVLAVLLSAAVSMPEDKVLSEYAASKSDLVDNFKRGTESALSRANFIRTTKLETLQAFVMYLIPLCRSEISRAHSALTGTAIRLAECMGLHRDGSLYDLSPVEIHVRRLVWYQLCFLDLRTCEATGPRPQIRREDFDTKYPLNVDDVDLESAYPPTEDVKHFTDMTITRMRIECYEMHRLIWIERPRIEKKKTTLTSLLSKIQTFLYKMEQTYLPMLNKKIPLHFMATQIHLVLSNRMYIMVLSKYSSNQVRLMPERLRQNMIGTGVLLLEAAMTIETTPALTPWMWYAGALHQYHTALLLLSEMYAKPREPAQEARIWRCLDFAFELPATLSGAEKSRIILGELRDRSEMYQSIRRVRAPADMVPAGPRVHSHEYKRQLEREEQRRRGESIYCNAANSGSQIGGDAALVPRMPDIEFSYTNTAAVGGLTDPVDASAFSFDQRGDGLRGAGLSPPHGSSSSPSLNMGGTGAGTSPGTTEMLDIDWNEWDRLFPPNMEAGDIMIPPFSFPQFSPTDLQWTDNPM